MIILHIYNHGLGYVIVSSLFPTSINYYERIESVTFLFVNVNIHSHLDRYFGLELPVCLGYFSVYI